MSSEHNKTRVEDILVEMIQPKINEIEEKFSRGDGLSQDDINTLLLKSQYNHINHLDEKLNEVTADVASLKGEFKVLESNFKTLEARFKTLEANIEKTIQKSLQKNMLLLVTVLSFFMTVGQAMEIFFG